MRRSGHWLLLAAACAAFGPLRAAAQEVAFSTPISGDSVEVALRLSRPADDSVRVELSIAPGEGRLVGFFGSVADESLLPAMSVGDHAGLVSAEAFRANRVDEIGGFNNTLPVRRWDFGLRFGSSAGAALEAVAFTLSAPGLDLAQLVDTDNQGWVFGVRVLSTNGAEGSAKIGLRTEVDIDTQPPVIDVLSPGDNAFTIAAVAHVSGTVTDASPIGAVTVNGVPAMVSGAAFDASVGLLLGLNTLEIVASDVHGNTSAQVLTVTRGVCLPGESEACYGGPEGTAGVGLCSAGQRTCTADGFGFGDCTGETLPQPETAGAPSCADGLDNDCDGGADGVDADCPQPPGDPLQISISRPLERATFTEASVLVEGSVSEPGAAVHVNGIAATVTGTSYVAGPIPLLQGPNVLRATAIVGTREASTAITVTRSASLPRILITTPRAGLHIPEPVTDVIGIVDPADCRIDVNGVPAVVKPGGLFVARAVPLAVGDNELIARAVDPEGAFARDRVIVTHGMDVATQIDLFVRPTFGPFSDFATYKRRIETPLPVFTNDPQPGPPLSAFSPVVDRIYMSPEPNRSYPTPDDGQCRVPVWVFSNQPGTARVRYPADADDVAAILPIPFPSELPFDREAPLFRIPGDDELAADPAFAQAFFDELFVQGSFGDEFFDPGFFRAIEEASVLPRYAALFSVPIGQPLLGEGIVCVPPAPGEVAIEAAVGSAVDRIELSLDGFAPNVTTTPAEFQISTITGNRFSITGRVDDTPPPGFDPTQQSPLLGAVPYTVREFWTSAIVARGEARLEDGYFVVPETLLGGPGLYTVSGEVFDLAGFNRVFSVTVEVDPDAPEVSLIGMQSGQAIVGDSAAISLNFANPVTLLRVNGVPDGRSFPAGIALHALSVELQLGLNTFELEFEGPSGPVLFAFSLTRLESFQPMRIVEPSNGALLNRDRTLVKVVAPVGTPAVEINGVLAAPELDGRTFLAELPLSQGKHTIRAVAVPFGLSNAVEVEVDSLPPHVYQIVPGSGTRATGERIVVAGLLNEPASVRVTQGFYVEQTEARAGASYLLDIGGAFLFELEASLFVIELFLEPGLNEFRFEFTDRAGNVTVDTRTYGRGDRSIELVSPQNGATIAASSVDLELDVVFAGTLRSVYVNGVRQAAVSEKALAPGRTTIPGLPLREGHNDVYLVYEADDLPSQEVLALAVASTAEPAAFATLGGTVKLADGQPVLARVTLTQGDATQVSDTAPDGSYRFDLAAGDFAVTVTSATDGQNSFADRVEAGQSLLVDVVLPGAPLPRPFVSIDAPLDGAVVAAASVEVTGRVERAETLTVNGLLVAASGSRYAATVALSPGDNVIAVLAGNATGSAGASVRVHHGACVGGAPCVTEQLGICRNGVLECEDGAPVCTPLIGPIAEICGDGIDQDCDGEDCAMPELEVLSPPAGAVTDFAEVDVVGTVSDPAATVVVNGVAAQTRGRTFIARAVPLAPGGNVLVATATVGGQPAGERMVSVTQVERVSEPQIRVVTPQPGAYVAGGGLVVRGFVNAREARVIVIGGGLARVERGLFTFPELALLPNATSLEAAAEIEVDGEPRRAQDAVPLLVGGDAPALSLRASPSAGDVPFSSELALGLSVSSVDVEHVDYDLDGDGIPEPDTRGRLSLTVPVESARVVGVRAFAVTRTGVEYSRGEAIAGHLPARVSPAFAPGSPVDLAPAPAGLYVLHAQGRIDEHDLAGGLVRSIGEPGSSSAQLNGPQALTVGPGGVIYVADTGNHRIQKYAPDGTHLGSIGAPGSGPGELSSPSGVVFAGSELMVADTGNHRVQSLDPDSGEQTASGEATAPLGLARLGIGVLIASMSSGLSATVGSLGSVLSALAPEARFSAARDVYAGAEQVYVAAAAPGRIVLLDREHGFARTLPIAGSEPRAVMAGLRRQVPSLYVADGSVVREIELPVPSPVPTVQALQERLLASDIDGVLALVDPLHRPRFAEMLQDAAAYLANDGASINAIELDLLRDDRAIVNLRSSALVQGQEREVLYPVHLSREQDGTWHIYDL